MNDESKEGWKFLVGAKGTYAVEQIQFLLDQAEIRYTMIASRKDDVRFYVLEEWIDEAVQFVNENFVN